MSGARVSLDMAFYWIVEIQAPFNFGALQLNGSRELVSGGRISKVEFMVLEFQLSSDWCLDLFPLTSDLKIILKGPNPPLNLFLTS